MSQNIRSKFGAPRVVLLVEIERYCNENDCRHLNRVPLTKDEARIYDGFKCERCENWNDDSLRERDVPEWWREIRLQN